MHVHAQAATLCWADVTACTSRTSSDDYRARETGSAAPSKLAATVLLS